MPNIAATNGLTPSTADVIGLSPFHYEINR